MGSGRLIFATGQATHWGGGVKHPRGERLAGWPCCVSGRRAYHIHANGRMTNDPSRVDCKPCLRMMRKSPELAAELGAQEGN